MNKRLAVGGSTDPNYHEIIKLTRELAKPTNPSLKNQSFHKKLAN